MGIGTRNAILRELHGNQFRLSIFMTYGCLHGSAPAPSYLTETLHLTSSVDSRRLTYRINMNTTRADRTTNHTQCTGKLCGRLLNSFIVRCAQATNKIAAVQSVCLVVIIQ